MKKLLLPLLLLSMFFISKPAYSAVDTLTIAEAIEDLDSDFVPDRKVTGDTVVVTGVIISPNFQLGNGNNEFFFMDSTAGVELFMFPPPQFNWALGDSLVVTGTIDQFNGVTELVPLDSASWDSVGTGTVPDPIALTLADYMANPEMYEGSLLWFGGLTKVTGNWSSGGSLGFSDGTDTVTFYIDSDTDIMGQTEPLYPVDIKGIGSQFDNSAPYDEGYEILPRFYTDFYPSMTIAEAIEDMDGDFVPDRLDDTVRVRGVIISPNFQLGNGNNEFFFMDNTAGVELFMFPPPQFDWALGDSLVVTGKIDQFNGVTELVPLDSASWDSVGTGTVPDPMVLKLAEYIDNPEMYEGSLLWFGGLTKVSGTWSSGGALGFSDGTDTVTFYIDSDTEISGQTEPTYPVDIIGIGSQFDNSAPYDGGYEILPRYYNDFTPTLIPVELTSFSATSQRKGVLLKWTTATELNNSGFEVERKQENRSWSKVAFLAGFGTTTSQREYTYLDKDLASGTYQYRLKQIDLDGTFGYSNVVEVKVVAPGKFELSQNYPNPFNPSTVISYSLPETGHVSLKIYNPLGQEVATLVNGIKEAGVHKIEFNAANFNSGIYFYRLEAGSSSQIKKMTLIK